MIAAGVTVLVLAGGGYAMFGRKPTAPATPGRPDSAAVQHDTSHAVAANPPAGQTPAPNPTPQQQQQQTLSRPTPTNPGPTHSNPPAGAKHDQTAIQHELDASINVIAGDNPSARRATLRRLAEIYGYTDLPSDMRADAARQSAVGFTAVADEARTSSDPAAEKAALTSVIDWHRKANQLLPTNKYDNVIAGAQARLQELGTP